MIQASCSNYYTVDSFDTTLYIPIYTYIYNSKEYKEIEGLALENEEPLIGSTYSIYIDSKKPELIIDEDSRSSKIVYLFDFILLILSIIVGYMGL